MDIRKKLLKEPEIKSRLIRKKAYWRRGYKRIPSDVLTRWLKEKLMDQIRYKLSNKSLEELYNLRESL